MVIVYVSSVWLWFMQFRMSVVVCQLRMATVVYERVKIVHGLAKACIHATLCMIVVCVNNVWQFSMYEMMGNSTRCRDEIFEGAQR